MAAAGLVVGTSGNVSVRAGDLVAVSPSGVDYAELTVGLVGVHRLDGTPVEAPLRPTSEMPLHLGVYAATALSTLANELPAIHYQVAMFGGPVPVAAYATYGSQELARNVVAALRDRTACLMANHGAVTTGQDLRSALVGSRQLEWLCEVYLRALAVSRSGRPAGPRLLPPGEIALVAGQLAGYGQRADRPEGYSELG